MAAQTRKQNFFKKDSCRKILRFDRLGPAKAIYVMPVTSRTTSRFLSVNHWTEGSTGATDGGSYGDPHHSNADVNCTTRAVVLRQVGANILCRLERKGSDATRAYEANARLVNAAA